MSESQTPRVSAVTTAIREGRTNLHSIVECAESLELESNMLLDKARNYFKELDYVRIDKSEDAVTRMYDAETDLRMAIALAEKAREGA